MSTLRPKQYRKKPVVIEAMEWDGSAEGATPIINWVLTSDETATYWCDENGCDGTDGTHYIAVQTLEGRMLTNAGDYIIKGVNGEFYPCKPDIFAKTYEAVE
jgi:hypothetical protein